MGVRDREGAAVCLTGPVDPLPSPRRTRVSIDFSRLPLRPFKTAIFLRSSTNPISRSFAIFIAKSSCSSDATDVPKIRDGLLLGGDGDCCRDISASLLDFEDKGKMDEADLKPNLLPGFGGNGGG
jgi:hypothetical protein